MSRQTKRLIPIAIILFWVLMTGLLLYREFGLPWLGGEPVQGARVRRGMLVARDQWMGVYVGGDTRVGFIHLHSTPEPRDGELGARMRADANIELDLFGRKTRLAVAGGAWISEEAGVREFDVTMKSGEQSIRLEGVVANGTLEARLHTAGEALPFTFPIADALELPGGLDAPSRALPVLAPGVEATVDAFDPTTLSMGKATIRCTGTETLTLAGDTFETYVITTTLGGVTTRAWVTEDEEVIRAETPFGFMLEKITAEEALAPIEPGEKADLIRTLATRPTGIPPKRGAARMRVRISGLEPGRMPPSDTFQTRTSDGYVITVPETPGRSDASAMALEGFDPAEYLAGDAMIASDHPRIREAARQAVGEAIDPWERAVRLHDWVYENIEKISVITIPTALEVLRTRQGDCNEHTVLYTAMARALEIPTRIAIGVVWSGELEAFGYHAWPEVLIEGRWYAMDPTLGQPLADATHLKLLNGGIERWTRLIPYIGQLQIEVLEIE